MTTTATPGREELLEAALRKLAIRQGVRMASGGGDVPNGGRCVLCKAEWDEPFKENEWHRSGCLFHEDARLAAKPADAGVREALIPAGIYFDVDGANFYSVERGCGCGQVFYSEWRSRAREFPQSKEGAIALMPPWRDMKSAPRNAAEIVLRIPSAGYPDHYAQIGHWAEMDGSEQPPAKGWFRNTGYGFVELPEPTGWRWPLMTAPSPSTTGEPKR